MAICHPPKLYGFETRENQPENALLLPGSFPGRLNGVAAHGHAIVLMELRMSREEAGGQFAVHAPEGT